MKYILTYCVMMIVASLNAQQISVMTYNIKLDYPKEGENSWATRKPYFINQLKANAPDILGVQEALPNQMKDMVSLLTDYHFVGMGRDEGNKGEHSAIFYKKDLFEIIETSTFWLSETPEKASLGWDAAYNRICTYALFKNRNTGNRFWVFNTHLDHIGVKAQVEGAKLILNKIKHINKQNLPVILMGDFNMEATYEGIQYLSKSLRDSKTIANKVMGPSGTFNNFEFDKPVTRRIDYIFLSEGITVNKYSVLSDSYEGHYPSDHLSVMIDIAFTK